MHMSICIAASAEYNYIRYEANIFCLYIVCWPPNTVFANVRLVLVVFAFGGATSEKLLTHRYFYEQNCPV